MLGKYYVTLSIVVDAASHEHAEELARQLASSCGKVAVHLIGQTSPQAAAPLVLDDSDLLNEEVGAGVELQLCLSRREAELLHDLCALQHEALQNAAILESVAEYRAELAVLRKFLDAIQTALRNGE